MKRIYSMLLLSMVLLCVGCDTPKALEPPPDEARKTEQKELRQKFQQLVKQGLQKADYAFRLDIQHLEKVEHYQGKQQSENWVILDQKGKKVMERKGEKVWAYHSGKKEGMSFRQAGLVSPRDHLQFLKQVYGSMERKATKNPHQKKIKVTVDPAKLAENFNKRLNTDSQESFFPIYEEMNIHYELVYSNTKNHDLKQMILYLHNGNESRQTLTYHFEG